MAIEDMIIIREDNGNITLKFNEKYCLEDNIPYQNGEIHAIKSFLRRIAFHLCNHLNVDYDEISI